MPTHFLPEAAFPFGLTPVVGPFNIEFYVNAAAEEDLARDGAVIVKENYSEQSEDTLMSVTVMEKRGA